MITLRTNYANIIGRIFMVIVLVFLSCNIGNEIINGEERGDKTVRILYVCVLCLAFLFIACIFSFLGILKVQVDKSAGSITLKKIFTEKTITCNEISGYYTTLYKGGRAKPWHGLLLKVDNGKSYRLTQQNLRSISELKEYLEKGNVKYLGEKRATFSF